MRSGPGYRIRHGTGGVSLDVRRAARNIADFHPFKIYQFPHSLRKFKSLDPTEGLRFKVRDGKIFLPGSTFSTITTSYGSDQIHEGSLNPFSNDYGLTTLAQIPPSDDSQWVSDGSTSTWNEIAIPADGQTYIFWWSACLPIAGGSWGGISLNTKTSGIAVCPTSDPTAAVLMFTGETFDATNVWPTMSDPDLYNFPIGTVIVDDGTYDAIYPGWPAVYIQQIQFGHFTLPGDPWGTENVNAQVAMRLRGAYNGARSYYVGDVVTITYADATGVNSLYQYIYDPPSGSNYLPYKISGGGPLIGISPNGNSPDPWRLLSKSPSDADYHTGAYDASKYYLRTA